MKVLLVTGNRFEVSPDLLSSPLPTEWVGDSRLAQALLSRGCVVDNMRVFDTESILAYKELKDYSLVINRFANETDAKVFDDLKVLEQILPDVPVINDFDSVRIVCDKLKTFRVLRDAGVPTPKTIRSDEFAPGIFETDLLVEKPLTGSACRGVRVGITGDQVSKKKGFIVQPFIQANECYRVILTQDSVLAAYRKEKEGELFKGILPVPENIIDLDSALGIELSELARKMILKTGLFYGGVDILREGDNLIGLEINYTPGIPRDDDAEALTEAILRR